MNFWFYLAIGLLLIPSALHLFEAYEEAKDRVQYDAKNVWLQVFVAFCGLFAALFIFIGANV